MDERHAILALSLIPEVGPNLLLHLMASFGSAQAALVASFEQLLLVPGIGAVTASAIHAFPWQKALEEELRLIERERVSLLVWGDPAYPEPLKHIPSPPPVLYLKGSLQERDQAAVAIVGSRRLTPYGRAVAEQIASDLASRGLTIVSGLARGIDSAAHRGALAVEGRTLAVLGSGLGRMYPPEHRGLAERIAASGAVLSEFPIATPPHAGNFPRRNRLISGLSLGVMVVEAGLESGALITAGYALEQGREVFAVPGPITAPMSRGCHRLIKQGAKLVETWEDVWEELKLRLNPPSLEISHSKLETSKKAELPVGEEERLYRLLEAGPLQIDELIAQSGLPPSRIAPLLLSLTMKGLLEERPGKVFARRVMV